MEKTIKQIRKITSKGQITLPASWCRENGTDTILMEMSRDFITISPAKLQTVKDSREYTVFDAIRDNGGKGIKATDLEKILKEVINE